MNGLSFELGMMMDMTGEGSDRAHMMGATAHQDGTRR